MLSNETYIGNLVQLKTQRVTFGVEKIILKDSSEFIRCENTHEAIIQISDFQKVQENIKLNLNRKPTSKPHNYSKFNGILKCADCGRSMVKQEDFRGNRNSSNYFCMSYLHISKTCTPHKIKTSELESINKYIELVCEVSDKIDSIVSISKAEYNSELKKIRLIEIDKGLVKYRNLMDELLQDYKENFISQEDYNDFKEKYLYEINKLNIEKDNLNKKEINSYNLEWINRFKKVEKIGCIDRNIVENFIENIYVGDNKEVEIEFSFKDQYKVALGYLKNQENML